MIVVDTNVFIYAADSSSPFHQPCIDWLRRQRKRPDAWFTTWPILYEFMRVVTHPRVLRRPWNAEKAWQFVASMLASPGLAVLVASPNHAAVARDVIAEMPHLRANIFHDAHTAILMRDHGIRRICTRDTGFHQFRFLEVIDPLSASSQ